MTGERFENLFCELLSKQNYWALKIPRDQRGAQPFDVIAVRGSEIWAVDCKVCATDRFPLSRIEDNQWLSFWQINKKTNAECGIVIYFDGNVYYISYQQLLAMQKKGRASLNVCDDDIIFTAEDIAKLDLK